MIDFSYFRLWEQVDADYIAPTARIRLPDGTAAKPAIVCASDSDTGFRYGGSGMMQFVSNGVDLFEMGTVLIRSDTTYGGNMRLTAGLVSNCTWTYRGDTDLGHYRIGADEEGWAAGGVLGYSIINDTSHTGVMKGVTAGITASTTQAQGNGVLTKDVNEVSVCANANDTVTLPTAKAGKKIIVINNGAQNLQVFPASGDNLGAGVDTSEVIATTKIKEYIAYDATNWVALAHN